MKDNRLLPRGFDKGYGGAGYRRRRSGAVPTLTSWAGGDHVRYLVDVAPGEPYDVDVELRFQPIGVSLGAESQAVRLFGVAPLRELLRLDGSRFV